jgi:(p)ppGpp synthase/HD superfamily hydrolase
MSITEKAAVFARQKHTGQTRDGGEDYFEHHIVKVAGIIQIVRPDDENLIAAAYLHDTIEDTDTTYKELVQEFNTDIANLVMEVTHEGAKDSYGYYFPRLKTKRGYVLKFADRTSNLGDMDAWEAGRQEQYLRKSKFWKDGEDRR